MGKLSLYMITSLDGFVADSDGQLNDYEPTDEEHSFANELFDSMYGVLFGRKTYQAFSDFWDSPMAIEPGSATVQIEFARIFARLKRVVVSRTLSHVDANARLIKSDLAKEVRQLKSSSGKDYVLVCGAELLATLINERLVDETLIMVRPIVMGRGTSLFGALSSSLQLQLLHTRTFQSGVVLHHYAVM